jgi:hypothetical protein
MPVCDPGGVGTSITHQAACINGMMFMVQLGCQLHKQLSAVQPLAILLEVSVPVNPPSQPPPLLPCTCCLCLHFDCTPGAHHAAGVVAAAAAEALTRRQRSSPCLWLGWGPSAMSG